jgi:hypothetical protein
MQGANIRCNIVGLDAAMLRVLQWGAWVASHTADFLGRQ